MTKIDRYHQITRLFLVLGDLAYIPLIYFGSYWIRSFTSLYLFQETMPFERIHWVNHRLWFLMCLHIALIYFHGLYDQLYTRQKNELVSRVIRAVTLEILILVSVYFFSQDIAFPRSIFMLLWGFIILFTVLWHLFWVTLTRKQIPNRKILIVGINEATKDLLQEIERLPSYGLTVVGVLTDDNVEIESSSYQGYPILGARENLLKIVNDHQVDEVVISSTGSWQEKLIDKISKTEQIPARICVIPTCYEILIGRINHLRLYDIPLIEVIKHPDSPAEKRIGDFLLALILFVISLPLFILTMAVIKITAGGPIFFQQERIGKNRISFNILKFRTMVPEAETKTGPVLSNEADERVTGFGKYLRTYRIDEMPQLINIMKGDMSFVGPRPERPYFVEQYIDSIPGYGERFKSIPGLTGLAQVNGGYATTPGNKLKYDLAYIYNQSFWLDARIILETVKVILTGQVNP